MRQLYALLIVVTVSAAAWADPPANFFEVQPGNVPILLLAPHGGNLQPTDIEAARSGLNPAMSCSMISKPTC